MCVCACTYVRTYICMYVCMYSYIDIDACVNVFLNVDNILEPRLLVVGTGICVLRNIVQDDW